jgi:hypothetical protein
MPAVLADGTLVASFVDDVEAPVLRAAARLGRPLDGWRDDLFGTSVRQRPVRATAKLSVVGACRRHVGRPVS